MPQNKPNKYISTPSSTLGLRLGTQLGRTICSVLALSASGMLAAEPVNKERIDWVPAVSLSQEQMDAVGRNCTGAYFYPTKLAGENLLPPGEAPIRATADTSSASDGNVYTLQGNVQAQQGSQTIQADRMIVDRETGNALVEGNVIVRDTKSRIAADSGHLNNVHGTAELKNSSVVIYQSQMRSDSQRFTKHRDASVHLTNATLTTCPPGTEDWVIEAQGIDIRDDNIWGVAKNPVFRFKGVPYMWLPFVTFPASDARLSGFLWPGLGFSDNGGLDFSAPFYWNLAPNYDLIVSPRYIHDRGLALETQFRHLAKKFNTQIDLAVLADDKGIDNRTTDALVEAGIIEEGDDNPFIDTNRWLVGVQHKGGSAHGSDDQWYTEIDFTKVSDQDYFRDIDNTSVDVNQDTHLLRQGTFGYRWSNWQTSVTATEYQTLDYYTVEPYHELPRWSLDGSYLYKGLLTELNHELVSFDQNDQLDINDNEIIKGDRARADYKVSYPLQTIWGFFTPSVYLKHLAYQLDDYNLVADAQTQQSFTALQTSLDGGLYFEREGVAFGKNYLQTFEPRLFYFYGDHSDQSGLFNLTDDNQDVDFDSADITTSYSQLFRDSRISGGDRIDDDNRLSVGLTTRFINSTSGREVLRASLGQIYYFQDRRTFVDEYSDNYISATNQYTDAASSEVAGELEANIGNNLNWTVSALYDDKTTLLSEGRTNLQYLDDKHRLINVGLSYRRKPDTTLDGESIEQHTKQSDISLMVPLSKKVNLIARNLHDFTFQRELDAFAGLEYNSCCYRARLVWRRWVSNDLSRVVADDDLNYKRGWFFDIQFKGFGSGTGKFYQLMSETIPGYTTREQAVFPE